MTRFAVCFYSDSLGQVFKILEEKDRDAVLKLFFEEFISGYSQDSEGFAWFKDDFFDTKVPMGVIEEI
jgi:hypothetical protein